MSRTTMDPLAPGPFEIALSAVTSAHVLLLVVVMVLVARGRLAVPFGLFGYLVLLVLPVLGPVLVLARARRVGRSRAMLEE